MTAKIATLHADRRPRPEVDLDTVVQQLKHSREVTHNIRHGGKVRELPSSSAVLEVLEALVSCLFPTHLGPHGMAPSNVDLFVFNTLSTTVTRLASQIERSLSFNAEGQDQAALEHRAQEIAARLVAELPAIRAQLVSDLNAAQARDPSAGSIAEVLICYRSSAAIIYHRIAHVLDALGARLIARMIAEFAHASTGIDIHPSAQIGAGFFINRGTGVVIGETSVIGQNVTIHQGVTLGEREVTDPEPHALEAGPRHPIIGDNVVIHAGATLLGRITIGAGSVICGNAWVTRSIPPGSIISQGAASHSFIQALG